MVRFEEKDIDILMRCPNPIYPNPIYSDALYPDPIYHNPVYHSPRNPNPINTHLIDQVCISILLPEIVKLEGNRHWYNDKLTYK